MWWSWCIWVGRSITNVLNSSVLTSIQLERLSLHANRRIPRTPQRHSGVRRHTLDSSPTGRPTRAIRNGKQIKAKQVDDHVLLQHAFILILYVHLVVPLVARVLLQDDKVLEDVRVRDVLLRRELGALCCTETHWCRVCLEARDCARLACLADDIDSLAGHSQ